MQDDHAALLMVHELRAGYGGEIVVGPIDLTLRAGQWLGLLGANGSGKSTLLRAITGQIAPLGGEVRIAGHNLRTNAIAAKLALGVAIDAAELPEGLTGGQYLELVASIRGCAADAWPVADLPGLLAAHPWFATRLEACSLGTRAKFALLAALLGAPPLLVLDESLNGLDPVTSWRVRQLLHDLVASGRHAVILSTHLVGGLDTLCTDVAFMAQGRIALRWGATELSMARAEAGGFENAVMRRIAGADLAEIVD